MNPTHVLIGEFPQKLLQTENFQNLSYEEAMDAAKKPLRASLVSPRSLACPLRFSTVRIESP